MGYLNQVRMAVSVAVVQGHADGGVMSNAMRSVRRVAKDCLAFASPAAADASAVAAASGLGIGRVLGGAGAVEIRRQADDSLRQAMYLCCWGPS